MSKTASAALKAHLAGQEQTTCTCWKVTFTNGTVKGFTDHDRNLIVSGVTYLAASGYKASAIDTSSALNVDNMEMAGILSSPAITEQELMSGIWDYAGIEVFLVNWKDLTMGTLQLRKGTLGVVSEGRNAFKAELRGKMQSYQQTFGRVYGVDCDADLGDSRCKVRLAPPTWLAGTDYAIQNFPGDAGDGDIVSPTTYNGRSFVCSTAGTSGATEPAWNTTVGGTTADGTVVWMTIAALTQRGSVTATGTSHSFTDSARTETSAALSATITGITKALPGVVTAVAHPFTNRQSISIAGVVGMTQVNGGIFYVTVIDADHFSINLDTTSASTYTSGGTATLLDTGYFGYGLLTWLTGLNAGLRQEVRRYLNGGIFTIEPAATYAIQVGDTYSVTVGCDKANATCGTKFDNIVNFRGFPMVPGSDKLYEVGQQSNAVPAGSSGGNAPIPPPAPGRVVSGAFAWPGSDTHSFTSISGGEPYILSITPSFQPTTGTITVTAEAGSPVDIQAWLAYVPESPGPWDAQTALPFGSGGGATTPGLAVIHVGLSVGDAVLTAGVTYYLLIWALPSYVPGIVFNGTASLANVT